ncbi:MAG: TolC family protein [Acidobacteria bacterium]|nr:TolC family protein [Acidobacteriota bacterium]
MSPRAAGRILWNVRKRIQIVSLCLAAATASAQDPLSLKDAVKQALRAHPSMEVATAKIQAAGSRIGQARSGYLPRVQYSETFQSGNNPVYVFGSLLTQRQFAAGNFALNKLNRPDVLNNFQSTVSAEQLIYDFGGMKNNVKAAELGKQMTEQERKALELVLIAGVARAYHGVTLSDQALEVAREALKTAEADQKRAETVRDAGMATESDVLSVKVHVAAMREQVIRRAADAKVARAAFNEALGLPLDTAFTLTTALAPAAGAQGEAGKSRPELEQLRLARQAAEAQAAAARSAYLPQVFMKGTLEADRQEFVRKGGANWMFVAGMKWNLFDGHRTRESVAEARAMAAAAQASERQFASAVNLEVRKAKSYFDAASERIAVTEATVAQADESLRILRNRYSNGLATITDLLRAQTALLDARTRRLAAIHDQRLAALEVERAAGILNGDSNVLE